ncbi:E3 SUMO-protein ligase RanBP2 [Chionoecetes opilio]|uniref:E3 SUMO-protein ligase RanBP2 n=1 Tax=Chionoecetes opilio TaxID=41210 RepID=A0A8J4Y4G6_CHIOP|nr:E3 SUMO-protein ligase RanBP2 [Chionoecetes opilio]
MPTPGLFGNPPFFPPSTIPDQTYSLASTANQGASITSMAQTTAALANPTSCSLATITVPSPSATTLGHSHVTASGNWTVANTMAGTPSRLQQACGDAPAPPHAFQITMPPSSSTLTPPPRAMPAFPGGFRTPTVAPQEPMVSPVKGHREAEDNNGCYVEDDHDPCPDYKPVVPLPEKVEVRTGEEDEQILFEERAKLFRYVEKEWRERGTGLMKLLHNPGQQSVRVLMRRDQTYKICANHLISANTELQAMIANDKAWIWAAQDYADEELRTEKFCCRFKTTELATNFRDAFMKAKAIAKAKEDSPSTEQTPHPPAPATAPTLAMLFKPKPGSWRCNICLVDNKQEAALCAACASPNPNASTPAKATLEATTASSPFASFKFSPSSIIVTEGGAVTPTHTPTPSLGGFKFMGTPSTTPSTTSTPSTSANTFGFKFTMSDITTPNTTTPTTTTTAPDTTTADTSKDSTKFSLSGFTFTTSPSLKAEKKAEEPMEEKKECVFAGFSFGSNAAPSVPSGGFTFATPSSSAAGSSGGFGGMSPAFSNLATTTTTTASSSFFTPKPVSVSGALTV